MIEVNAAAGFCCEGFCDGGAFEYGEEGDGHGGATHLVDNFEVEFRHFRHPESYLGGLDHEDWGSEEFEDSGNEGDGCEC